MSVITGTMVVMDDLSPPERPLLLIDVDNVLNVSPGPRRPNADWQVHKAQGPCGAEYTLHLNPEHGRWLTGLAELFELTWCTTWWRVANERIAPLVGLPDLPAVELPDVWSNVPLNFSAKTPHVRRYAQGRALAWIDDDIDDRDAEALTRLKPDDRSHLPGTQRCASALTLNVEPDIGLTESHIERLRAWGELRGAGAMAQAALREERWQTMERTGGFLSESDIASLSQPVRASLVGVQRPGGMRYPAFQLVGVEAAKVVPPAWHRLRELLAPAAWGDESLLLWVSAPNAYLDGRSPADEIKDHPAEVTEALRYAVTRAIPDFLHLAPGTSRALGDFLTLAHTAARLVERGRAAYDADEAPRLAAETILRRISAAVSRVDDGFVESNPSVHWRQMVGMGNVIATGPGTEDYDAIWNTLETDLPQEAAEVRHILRHP